MLVEPGTLRRRSWGITAIGLLLIPENGPTPRPYGCRKLAQIQNKNSKGES